MKLGTLAPRQTPLHGRVSIPRRFPSSTLVTHLAVFAALAKHKRGPLVLACEQDLRH